MTATIFATDRDRELFEQWQQSDPDLGEIETRLRTLEATKANLLTGTSSERVEERLAQLDPIDDQIANTQRDLNRARNRRRLLGDRVHDLRVTGRARQVAEREAQMCGGAARTLRPTNNQKPVPPFGA